MTELNPVILTKRNPLRKEDLDNSHYTLSLIRKGLETGIIDRRTLPGIQEQALSILRDLVLRHTKHDSASVTIETAEKLLRSAYYSIDAYMRSFTIPEDALAELTRSGMKEAYEKGIALVAQCLSETKLLYRDIKAKKLKVPLDVYNYSIDEALPEFFESYNTVFGAHSTVCMIDYPLVFDDMAIEGIYYIKRYLDTLRTETLFCRSFDEEDIVRTIVNYGRVSGLDYRESPMNIFEALLNNSIFATLAGHPPDNLSISNSEAMILGARLAAFGVSELEQVVNETLSRIIKGLKIQDRNLMDYIEKYKGIFVHRLANAVENGGLINLVASDEDPKDRENVAFLDEERLCDKEFRSLIQKVSTYGKPEEKADLVMSIVHSLGDYLDFLNAGCLYDDDFRALFNRLGDIELAVLSKVVLHDEFRNGQVSLSSVNIEDYIGVGAPEWQQRFIAYVIGLGDERTSSIDDIIKKMDGSNLPNAD